MSRLTDLLYELGQYGDLYEEYMKDPEGVMQRYELSREEVDAMLAKDVDKLKRISGLEKLKSNDTVHAHDS